MRSVAYYVPTETTAPAHSALYLPGYTSQQVWEYFEEEGVDMDGAEGDEILEADEVFDIGDGRYLIVEG